MATAGVGYGFAGLEVVSGGVTLDLIAAEVPRVATFEMPNRNVTIRAIFEPLESYGPYLALSPPWATFGIFAAGDTPNPVTMTLTNNGNAAAAVSAITFGGADPDSLVFVTAPTFPINIAAGASATFAIQPATELAAGQHATLVTVAYNDGRTVAAIVLFEVTIPAGAVTLTMLREGSGTLLVNGAIQQPDREIVIGQGDTTTIVALASLGYSFYGWEVVEGNVTLQSEIPQIASFVMPGNDVIIRARFTPLSPGTPYLVLDPTLVDFSSRDVGLARPDPVTVIIRNNGDVPATVSGFTLGGVSPGSFELAGYGGISVIAAHETASFTVQPGAALTGGMHTAIISVEYAEGMTAAAVVRFEVIDPNPPQAGITFTFNPITDGAALSVTDGNITVGNPSSTINFSITGEINTTSVVWTFRGETVTGTLARALNGLDFHSTDVGRHFISVSGQLQDGLPFGTTVYFDVVL